MNLATKTCVACEGGIPPFNAEQAAHLAQQVPGWTLGERSLSRTYHFTDFPEAMRFVNSVAELAEAEGHHPDIAISYSTVTLTLTTHAIGGLSENDFILAAKIDAQESNS